MKPGNLRQCGANSSISVCEMKDNYFRLIFSMEMSLFHDKNKLFQAADKEAMCHFPFNRKGQIYNMRRKNHVKNLSGN